jgi:hypothetical protein
MSDYFSSFCFWKEEAESKGEREEVREAVGR